MSGKVLTSATAAVDWLTVTTKTDKASANLIAALFESKPAQDWYKEANHAWKFKGFAGRAFEGIRYGLRGEEAIVMLSGPRAQQLWDKVAPARDKCTRIDLAVTVELFDVDLNVAKEAYQSALDGISTTNSMVLSSRGGQTVYLGSRQSQFMGRLYDKGAEEGLEPGKIWRFELECKKPSSEAVVARLLTTADVPSFIAEYVATWFESRAVVPLWFRKDIECAIELHADVQTHEKTLEWLRSQVKPALGRLIVADLGSEAYEALGLPTSLLNSQQKEFEGWQ